MRYSITHRSVLAAAGWWLSLAAVASVLLSAANADDNTKRHWGEAVNDQAISIATDKGGMPPGRR